MESLDEILGIWPSREKIASQKKHWIEVFGKRKICFGKFISIYMHALPACFSPHFKSLDDCCMECRRFTRTINSRIRKLEKEEQCRPKIL